MNLKIPILLILLLKLLSISIQAAKCDQFCGGRKFQYPFGFSDGCLIRLNCSSNSVPLINNFTVISIDSDFIRINVDPVCTRRLEALRDLYAENYAPSSRNAILLHSCPSGAVVPCTIPAINVQTHFEMVNCSKSSINCYSQNKIEKDGFVDYNNLSKTDCKYFLSSISAETFNDSSGMSLDVRIAELEWWINGEICDQCSENAYCRNFSIPGGNSGYRCECKEGFAGDGYNAGDDCKGSDCTPAKLLIGKCGGKTRLAVLIGGIATGSFLIIGVGLLCCIMKRRSKTKYRNIKIHRLSTAATSKINIPIYPYREIEKATNNFSEKQRLGTGAYGTVYAGKLQNDLWIAVKRLKHRDTDCIEQVLNEIKLISSVSHPNLVRLLGCSIDNAEQILVYEFMPNGTLFEHLQREKGDGIPWEIRLTIAHETAQAIAHLHFAIDPPIYHRDVKTSNILLDFNFRSKVADFGLSRLGKSEISHISTAPQGTPGYVDPEYHQNFHLSDKSDVYSFGVVLVEIITGLKAVDFYRAPNEVNLAALANDRISKGQLEEIIDPFIEPHSDAWMSSSIHKVAELAFRCLSFHRDMRPTMKEVAEELEHIRGSRWGGVEEIAYAGSIGAGTGSSSSSNVSEKPLSTNKERGEVFEAKSSIGSVVSMGRLKGNSPVSVQDPWMSETSSSPSSSSLLSSAMMR